MTDYCKIKFIVLGESGVGKTSLLFRYAKRNDYLKPTIIIDRLKKDLIIQNKQVHLELWDTGGMERFRSVSQKFFRDADGVLLVYDVTNMNSFLSLSSWLLDLKAVNNTAISFIVGNKIDHPNRNAVCVNQVRSFAEEEKLEFHESSARSGENVDEIFERLTLKVLEAKEIIPNLHSSSDSEKLESSEESNVSEESIDSSYSVIPIAASSDLPDTITLQETSVSGKKKKKC